MIYPQIQYRIWESNCHNNRKIAVLSFIYCNNQISLTMNRNLKVSPAEVIQINPFVLNITEDLHVSCVQAEHVAATGTKTVREVLYL